MDFDAERIGPRYRLTSAGFGLLGVSFALLCMDVCCSLVVQFSGNPAIGRMRDTPFWTWFVGAPITWASLIGSYLLWGRWKEAVWQRRVGLLVLLNSLDLLSWGIHHSADLGLRIGPIGHEWLRDNLTQVFGWVEMALTAGLAADLIFHLDETRYPDLGRSAPALTIVGLGVTALMFAAMTNWDAGWPLRAGFNIRNPLIPLLMLGYLLILAVTTFQVTLLCIHAASRSRRFVDEWSRHAGQEHELLKSRSEMDDFG